MDKWHCPVCDTKCDSQHSFTVHIRQHNPTDHSHTCSICSKTLSSASSLDRHMLIHSGERPFKCKTCNMTFTTNGNMHRHMRTHGNDKHLKSDGLQPPATTSPPPPSATASPPPSATASPATVTATASPPPPSATTSPPAIASSPTTRESNKSYASIGFHDLTFTDFSSHKYPLIAQSFCESNIRKSSSPFHNFQCTNCPKAFPCAAALKLHQQKAHNSSNRSNGRSSLKIGAENETKPSSLSNSTFCHLCQIDLGSSVMYLTHQGKHRCENFLSVVNGGPTNSSPSSFPKAIVTNPTITSDKLPSTDNTDCGISNGINDLNNDHHSTNTDNEKEHFLAMLQLHKKNITNGLVKVQPIDGSSPFKDEQSNFDNPSYYIKSKPSLKRLKRNSITKSSKAKSKVNAKTSTGKMDGYSSDKTKETKKQAKNDLTDISYTNSKDSLLKNMTSSSSLLSSTNPASLDDNKINFKKRKLSSSTSPSSARSPSRGSTNLPLQDNDKINGDNRNPPSVGATSTSSSHYGDGEKEMEIDLSENNSSGTTGSMEKENSEENDAGESVNQNSEMNATETQQNHRCDICSLDFKSSNALKRHNRGHSKTGHNYICNMCSYTSLDKSTLVRHLRTHNGERPFQCAICKYAFTTKSNCERHVRKRHKKLSKPEIKSAMFFNAGLSTSSSTTASSQVTIQNITRHNSLPNISGPEWPGPQDTLCRFCNLDLKSNKLLRHHIKTLHNSLNQKPYSCTLCKMGFSTKNNCIRHVIRLHPEMKKDIKSVVLINGTSVPSQSGSDDISESEAATFTETSSVGGNSNAGSGSRRKTLHQSNSSAVQQDQDQNNSTFAETSSNPSSSLPLPNVSGHEDAVDAITLAWQFHSSLAALCQIISPISPIPGNAAATASSATGLQGAVENQPSAVVEDYDGDESNGEPLDLAKTQELEKKTIPAKGTTKKEPVQLRRFRAHGESQPLDLAAHALDLSCKTTPIKLETQSNFNQSLLELNKCSEPIRTAASSLLALQSFIPASK